MPVSDGGHTYSARECAGICVLTLIVTWAVVFTSYRTTLETQNELFRESFEDFTQQMGSHVGEIKTVLSSLTGWHYAATDVHNTEMNTFAEQLRSDRPYLKGVGKFEFIRHEELDYFNTTMSERGLYNFEVKTIAANGELVSNITRDYYLPVSFIEPMTPLNARILGIDMRGLENSPVSRETLTEQTAQLISVPDGWPIEGSLIALKSAYYGMQPSTSDREKLEQLYGAYWVSIDVAQMLPTDPLLDSETVSISISHAEGERTLFHQQSERGERIFFNQYFPEQTSQYSWAVGGDKLELQMTREPGISLKEILVTVLIILMANLFVLLILTLAHNRRKSVKDKHTHLKTLYKERLKAEKTLNSITDSVLSINGTLGITHLNPAAMALLCVTREQAIDNSVTDLITLSIPEDPETSFDVKQALLDIAPNGKHEYDALFVNQDGITQTLKMTLSRLQGSNGYVAGYIMVLRDVSKERRLTQELEYQATHDTLTNCTNRYYFEKELTLLLEADRRQGTEHALCYMDLDQFKIVNDTCGHSAGDKLLKELTDNLNQIIRSTDIMSRLGGDEFGLIIKDVNAQQALKIAQRFHQFFQNYTFHFDNKAFPVRASIGLVQISRDFSDISEILSAADIACYSSKDSGRNALHVYSEKDEKMAARYKEMNWLPKLQDALVNNYFCLYAQAIASLSPEQPGYHIDHYEFLIRLIEPDGTEVGPNQFIQAAERYDLMRELDRWVIVTALRTVAGLRNTINEDTVFSINLSGQSAADPTLLSFLTAQFEEHGVNPANIWFELTETAAISHFSVAVELIEGIRCLGAKVALDDFGSGLSSFGYLKNLPVNVVKIDGQFVKNIDNDPVDQEMVRAIHRIGRSMGIETVAEFVESDDAIQVLRDIGVDYAQGYFIAKPMPVDEALAASAALRLNATTEKLASSG